MIAAVLFIFGGGPPLICEIAEKAAAMKTISLSTRYHRVTCMVLAFLLCAALVTGFAYYRWAVRKHIEVYELTWPDSSADGRRIYRRWRYFIDSKTDLPCKIEKYSRGDPNDKYILQETLIISYPAETQIRTIIEDTGLHDSIGP